MDCMEVNGYRENSWYGGYRSSAMIPKRSYEINNWRELMRAIDILENAPFMGDNCWIFLDDLETQKRVNKAQRDDYQINTYPKGSYCSLSRT